MTSKWSAQSLVSKFFSVSLSKVSWETIRSDCEVEICQKCFIKHTLKSVEIDRFRSTSREQKTEQKIKTH